MSLLYFDNNATTRPLPEVVDAVAEASRRFFANPGSPHRLGRQARTALDDAREQVAEILHADAEEVVFTSGGTEASNMAITGFAGPVPSGMLALTKGEHPASREPCRRLTRQCGHHICWLPVDQSGRISIEDYEALPWNELRLVTVLLAHNETGVIQDLAVLSERCQQQGVPFHIDGVQAAGKIDVHFNELGCSSLAIAAHKFHGPRGIGALLLKRNSKPLPLLRGGFQERGRRAGTECVALAVGMATALRCWHDNRQERTETMRTARDRLQHALVERCQPALVHGAHAKRLPNTLSIGFPGCDGDALLLNLDLAGVACSLGSACASGSTEPAPALLAMGVAEDVARSSLRLSVSFETTTAEVDAAAEKIVQAVSRLRNTSASCNPT